MAFAGSAAGDPRFRARAGTGQEDDVSRAARHNSSQEPGAEILHRRKRKPTFMEIMNNIGNQVTIRNGYGRALRVESPPVGTRKVHEVLEQFALLGRLGRLVGNPKKL